MIVLLQVLKTIPNINRTILSVSRSDWSQTELWNCEFPSDMVIRERETGSLMSNVSEH